MLCIEPYERPVDATNVRMLAPFSYSLRNSFKSWSLGLLDFFWVILPGTSPRTCDAPTDTQRRKLLHPVGGIG